MQRVSIQSKISDSRHYSSSKYSRLGMNTANAGGSSVKNYKNTDNTSFKDLQQHLLTNTIYDKLGSGNKNSVKGKKRLKCS